MVKVIWFQHVQTDHGLLLNQHKSMGLYGHDAEEEIPKFATCEVEANETNMKPTD